MTGSFDSRNSGEVIKKELATIQNDIIREETKQYLKRIEDGKRDLYL
ncbi:MAG: hypothetical protein M1419_07400 [Bacteroidetes bacterium]|nr:hypothetical protein [Bacteroidota bacterium]